MCLTCVPNFIKLDMPCETYHGANKSGRSFITDKPNAKSSYIDLHFVWSIKPVQGAIFTFYLSAINSHENTSRTLEVMDWSLSGLYSILTNEVSIIVAI